MGCGPSEEARPRSRRQCGGFCKDASDPKDPPEEEGVLYDTNVGNVDLKRALSNKPASGSGGDGSRQENDEEQLPVLDSNDSGTSKKPPAGGETVQGVTFCTSIGSDDSRASTVRFDAGIAIPSREPVRRQVSATEVRLIRTIDKQVSNRLKLIIENPRPIAECYNLGNMLGEGAFGAVRKAHVKSTNAPRAVKSVLKGNKHRMNMLKREIEITKMVDHPNLIKLYEVFEDVTKVYLVMELCQGGTLGERLRAKRKFNEAQTAAAMFPMMRAVCYLHQCQIAHRDLKPENFLIANEVDPANPDDMSRLKITDFGLSCVFQIGEELTSTVGTITFMAPEVLAKSYDQSCDIWSCGVIMYVLLSGYLPFRGDTDEKIKAKIRNGKFSFDATHWVDTTEAAMDLISSMMRVNRDERSTAHQALHHEWMLRKAPKPKYVPLRPQAVKQMRLFRLQSMLKRAGLQLIASLLCDDDLKAAHEAFVALDNDGDGTLSLRELQSGAVKATPADRKLLEEQILPDGGTSDLTDYTYTEFIAATFDRKKYVTEEVCRAAFKFFDHDGDGKISKEELHQGQLLGHLPEEELQKIVLEIDDNDDGAIDFTEFMTMMRADG